MHSQGTPLDCVDKTFKGTLHTERNDWSLVTDTVIFNDLSARTNAGEDRLLNPAYIIRSTYTGTLSVHGREGLSSGQGQLCRPAIVYCMCTL
jgi:hypothetical protein